jgi:glycosyltransferase involved in cell wall biosynthesis
LADIIDDIDKAFRPLVSVIIPAHNARKYVLEAIGSVLLQNYAPIEILLIDDGSTDGMAELVQREMPQVRIIQQANVGVAAARNTGLRHVTGELICFLDADDGWFPGKLAAQVSYLARHPQVGLVYHPWLVRKPNANGVFADLTPPQQTANDVMDPAHSGWIYLDLLLDCIVHTSSVMLRRAVAQKVGFFNQALSSGEDYHYWLRVSRQCEMHKQRGVYSFYRDAANSLTNTPKTINFCYLIVQKAVKEWGVSGPDGRSLTPQQINNRLAGLAFGFGYLQLHSGSPRLATQAFLDALKHDALLWRAYPYLIASQLKTLGTKLNPEA